MHGCHGNDGSFRFEYASDNGLAAGEVIEPDGSRVGAYQYKDPSGQLVKLKYRAGKEGFQILEGSHLPQSPQPQQPDNYYQNAYAQQKQYDQQQYTQRPETSQDWTPQNQRCYCRAMLRRPHIAQGIKPRSHLSDVSCRDAFCRDGYCSHLCDAL
ncbi:Cuticle protein 6 [Papilio machaon]|uniref:Cuticle protein 6 n=1 Tax=Papilio machaon TaxID=76193 RepID=A0A0N0PD24_PAPMA|nr:Cuticle protein 6 [Papilio machaon]